MTAAATTLFPARRVITMEPRCPDANSVAVSGRRIVGVGSFEDLRGFDDAVVDETSADAVVCPGFIDQHLHPILGATTLATEVIAPEEWALPSRVLPAAHSEDGYHRALRDAERALTDPRTWLFSWGYHPLWHGRLDRGALDELSRAWPIGVWHRSCHEWFLNSAVIEALGITRPGSCISKSSAPKALRSCRHFSSMRAARPMPAWIPPTRWPTPRRRSRARAPARCGCCPST